MKKSLLCLLLAVSASTAPAATIQYTLIGTGGAGLLASNEPGSIVGGSGGEILGGITFDDVTNMLSINAGWGSANGFTNLSSTVTASHIHGPTASVNGNDGTGNFKETAGVTFTLIPTSTAASGGQFLAAVNSFPLSAVQAVALNNGRFYINVHTTNNGGGEMRGFIVPVPEPGSSLLALASLGGLLLRRRRA